MNVLCKGYNGEKWVEGFPVFKSKEDCYILKPGETEPVKIYKDSLCMYTGLKDRYGHKIFENDEVELDLFKRKASGIVRFRDGCFIVESSDLLLNGARHDYLKCYTVNYACVLL